MDISKPSYRKKEIKKWLEQLNLKKKIKGFGRKIIVLQS